jgi:hypothetical protein
MTSETRIAQPMMTLLRVGQRCRLRIMRGLQRSVFWNCAACRRGKLERVEIGSLRSWGGRLVI